ncbi:MAG: sulfotransferase [Longimicrobiales bacterium]
MVAAFRRQYRRLRYGEAIIVVSGLPRSGTSMMMKMLAAGGVPLATDELRAADESNPEGYFELERVKTLEQSDHHPWLADCRGRAIKIISFLLPHLPDAFNYRVVFMHRQMPEVIASQDRMLERRGEAVDPAAEATAARFQEHLAHVRRLLHREPWFASLDVSYNRVVADPEAEAIRVNRFLGAGLDVRAMRDAVNPDLYRNRG